MTCRASAPLASSLVKFISIWPIFPPLHKSCAEWIFLNVKPFVVQRFTRAQQPIEITRCYFQEGFSSWRILRFNAAEKFPSLASRSFVGATMT